MAGLKFRVIFDNVKKTQVFRDILINDNFTFEQFYYTIVDAFGFSDDKMASFYVSNFHWDKGEELCLVDMAFEQIDNNEEAIKEMNSVLIRERITDSDQHFILIHDYLAQWIFLIELIEVTQEVVDHPMLILEVGEVPKDIKEKETRSLNTDEFDDVDFDDDDDDFYDDDFDDGYDDEFDGFEDIDDYDF